MDDADFILGQWVTVNYSYFSKFAYYKGDGGEELEEREECVAHT